VRNNFERGNLEEYFDVVHATEPRAHRAYGSPFNTDMRFSSCWWERDATEGVKLRESGYMEFPWLCPRWWVNGEDAYGHSPGMEALPDVKQLQVEHKHKLEGIEAHVKPPLVLPPSLRNEPKDTLPGGYTYLAELEGQRLGRPLYEVKPELAALLEDIREVQSRIKRAFFEDLFLLITNIDRSNVTATEIAQRQEEKLLMIGPVLERLEDELLDPLIDRSFAILLRRGLLPEAPRELAGQELRVEYISILAQAQRAVGTSAIDRFLGLATAAAGLQPSVLDKIDFDQVVDSYGEKLGVPPDIIRSDDQVIEIRQMRAQQEAQANAMANIQAATEAAKNLADSPLDQDNALRRGLQVISGG
jgi:hypothetical protein